METGRKAWLACQTFERGKPAVIELPDGWRWKAEDENRGCLYTPEGDKCAGYDLETETLQFGADGVVKAKGLNAWVAQEMGEKFAQELMDEDTKVEYKAYAEKRRVERSDFDKAVRTELASAFQMELKNGDWSVQVDMERLTGTGGQIRMSRSGAAAVFNQMSEVRGVMPLRDSFGYMTRENNLYQYVKDQYVFQYEDTIDNIEAGFINGNGRGCEAVLNNLDAVVKKNMREYCLPEGVRYQDLRYVEATPKLQEAANAFVRQRVTKTVNFEKKRSHSQESLERDHRRFLEAAESFRDAIGEEALGTLTLSDEDVAGLEIPGRSVE